MKKAVSPLLYAVLLSSSAFEDRRHRGLYIEDLVSVEHL